MIDVQKYKDMGTADYTWLKARYHFSFANYYNPKRMGFGELLVVNDDIIKAGGGFDFHPHKNMEIITYVRQGAITHKDSMGNEGRTEAGDVQVMSAGTGVFHSEFNLESEDTKLFQIWIKPETQNVQPRWEAKVFPKSKKGFNLLVSGIKSKKNEGALYIHQQAEIYGAVIKAGEEIDFNLNNLGYVIVVNGELSLNETSMSTGDAAQVSGEKQLTFQAKVDTEVLLIDTP